MRGKAKLLYHALYIESRVKSGHHFLLTIVDFKINETLQTGAVRKPHLPGGESVYLFLEFTIINASC